MRCLGLINTYREHGAANGAGALIFKFTVGFCFGGAWWAANYGRQRRKLARFLHHEARMAKRYVSEAKKPFGCSRR